MENNRYTQEEFNDLFFSPISMAYLFFNIILITIGLLASRLIIAANPTQAHNPEDQEMDDFEDIIVDEEATIDESGYDSSSTVEPKVKTRKSKDLEVFQEIKIVHKEKKKQTSRLDFFQNERWRILPLLIFPYTA